MAGFVSGFFYFASKTTLSTIRLINKHLGNYKKVLLNRLPSLEEWKEDEHELISLKTKLIKKPRFWRPYLEGIIQNVFHEPVIAFIQKKYGSNGKVLTVFMRKGGEWVTLRNAHGTMIYQDGSLKAVLLPDGHVVTPDGEHLIMTLRQIVPGEWSVLVKQVIVAAIAENYKENSLRPRAVIYYQKVERDLIYLITVMTFLRIVSLNVAEKSWF